MRPKARFSLWGSGTKKFRTQNSFWARLASALGALMLLAFSATACDAKPLLGPQEENRILEISAMSEQVRETYPLLRPFIEQKGLLPLTRALLTHDRPELRVVGLRLAAFHRLRMLDAEILQLVRDGGGDAEVQDTACGLLPFTGIGPEEALAKIDDIQTQARVVMWVCLSARAMGIHDGDPLLLAMCRLLWWEDLPIETRRETWFWMAGARYKATGCYAVLDADYWRLAETLEVSPGDYVYALLDREPEGLEDKLMPFLDSPDYAARAQAAAALVSRFHKPEPIRILFECLPHFDKDMRIWGSVGNFCLQSILGIQAGILLTTALEKLSDSDKKTLADIVGADVTTDRRVQALAEFLHPRNNSPTELKNRVCTIIAEWWLPRLGQLHWFVSTPELRLMQPIAPEESTKTPPGTVGEESEQRLGGE